MGTLVMKNRGQLIPDLFLERVLRENKGHAGAVFVDEGQFEIARTTVPWTLEEVNRMQTACQDFGMMFYFDGGETKGINNDDLQPFELLRDGSGNVKVVAFLEGNFSGFRNGNSSHTPEFLAVQTGLVPRLSKIFKLVGYDVDKFLDEVNEEQWAKENIHALWTGRGTITMASDTNELTVFSSNDLMRVFDPWGWASNHHGITDKDFEAPEVEQEQEQPATPVEEKPAPKVSRLAAILGRPVASTEPVKPVVAKTETSTAALNTAESNSASFWRPSEELKGGQIKDAYKKKIGYAPPGWKQRPWVDPVTKKVVDAPKILKSLQDLPAPKLEEPAKKDVVPHNIPEPEKKEEVKKEDVRQPLPFITKEHKSVVENILTDPNVAKMVDAHGQKMEDPKQLKEYESRYPTFAESMGVDMESTFKYPISVLLEMGKKAPNALVVLAMNWRSLYLRTLASDKKHEAKPEVKPEVQPEAKPASVPEVKPAVAAPHVQRRRVAM